MGEFRDKPPGTVRITSIDVAADMILWPRLSPLLLHYPEIKVKIDTSYQLVDIVEEKYDFGVRSGESVVKDMVAARISADFRRVIVGAPAYFADHPVPQSPQDLLTHNCITLRLARAMGSSPGR